MRPDAARFIPSRYIQLTSERYSDMMTVLMDLVRISHRYFCEPWKRRKPVRTSSGLVNFLFYMKFWVVVRWVTGCGIV